MINKIRNFMMGNLELMVALDLLIISGVCYFFEIPCYITFAVIGVYLLFVIKKFKNLLSRS